MFLGWPEEYSSWFARGVEFLVELSRAYHYYFDIVFFTIGFYRITVICNLHFNHLCGVSVYACSLSLVDCLADLRKLHFSQKMFVLGCVHFPRFFIIFYVSAEIMLILCCSGNQEETIRDDANIHH